MSGWYRCGGPEVRAWPSLSVGTGERAGDEEGFSLIEVIIAIVLVTGLMVATTVLVVGQVRVSANNEYAIAAANLANQTLSADETESFSTLIAQAVPSGAAYVQYQTVGSIKYTISTSTYWQPESTTAGGCDNPGNGSGSGLADILLVQVNVTWGMQGQDPARADTLITPPVTQGSSSDGNFAIEVEGPAPANTPMAGVPVAVSGPGGASNYYTDANGCLFLGYQTPGNYTFTLTPPSFTGVGWVTQTEQTTDSFGTTSAPIVLAAGQTITQVLDYAQGASIVANFTDAGPAPIGLPVTIANSSLVPITGDNNSGNGTYSYPGGSTSATSQTITPVWTYSNGYSVFAGHCPEADPAAVDSSGTALYAGSVAAPTVAVTTGASTAVNVPLYGLTVNVTSTSHASVAGLTAVLNEQAGVAKSACSPLGSYNLPTATSAAGSTTAGIPLGTFTVTLLKSGSPVMCTVGRTTSPCASASFAETGSAQTAAVTIP